MPFEAQLLLLLLMAQQFLKSLNPLQAKYKIPRNYIICGSMKAL